MTTYLKRSANSCCDDCGASERKFSSTIWAQQHPVNAGNNKSQKTHPDDAGNDITYPGIFEIMVVVEFVFECEFCEGARHHIQVARHWAE